MVSTEFEGLAGRNGSADHPVDIVELTELISALEIPLLSSTREEAW